jgi:hypothetical protein
MFEQDFYTSNTIFFNHWVIITTMPVCRNHSRTRLRKQPLSITVGCLPFPFFFCSKQTEVTMFL